MKDWFYDSVLPIIAGLMLISCGVLFLITAINYVVGLTLFLLATHSVFLIIIGVWLTYKGL